MIRRRMAVLGEIGPDAWPWKASFDNSDVAGSYRHPKSTFQPGLFKIDHAASAVVRSRRGLETVSMGMVVKTMDAKTAKARDPQWALAQIRCNGVRFRNRGTRSPTIPLVE